MKWSKYKLYNKEIGLLYSNSFFPTGLTVLTKFLEFCTRKVIQVHLDKGFKIQTEGRISSITIDKQHLQNLRSIMIQYIILHQNSSFWSADKRERLAELQWEPSVTEQLANGIQFEVCAVFNNSVSRSPSPFPLPYSPSPFPPSCPTLKYAWIQGSIHPA